MILSMIAARSANGVIGKNKALIWHLPADLKFFKQKTQGHHIIMGRRTFESIGSKPLPNRVNIVVSRKTDWNVEGCFFVQNLEEALKIVSQSDDSEPFIVGGAELYRAGFEVADRLYLTEVRENFEGDTFFPEIPRDWKEVLREKFEADEKNIYAYDFVVFERFN